MRGGEQVIHMRSRDFIKPALTIHFEQEIGNCIQHGVQVRVAVLGLPFCMYSLRHVI
jgi:hypothetical protein